MPDESPAAAPAPRLPPHILPLAGVAALFHLLMQWSFPSLAEFDAYYHVGLADVYLHHGPVRHFPWMSMSILRDRFNDPQLLLHLLTMPLVAVGIDPMIAGKLVAVVMATGLALVFYWFLWRQRTRFAVWWTLVFLVGSPYLVARLTFVKSTALFLALVLVFLDALATRNRRGLFVLSWLAVLTYQGFPLLLVLALLYLGAAALVGEEKFSPELLGPVVVGFFAGLVINPFFPNDLYFFHFEIVQQILLKPKELALGAEWQPIDTVKFAGSTLLALLFLFFSEVLSAVTRAGADARLLVVRALAALLLVGALFSSRLIEYFVPFALAASALTVSRALDARPAAANLRVAWGLALFLCAPAAVFNVKEGLRIAQSVAGQIDVESYRRAAAWLTENTADGDVVVTQWDDFPMLFFFDKKDRYLYGLNSAYGYGYDSRLYTVHSLLYEGRIRDPESFLPQVGARYLLVARPSFPARQQLVAALKANAAFEEVLAAPSITIFRLRAHADDKP